MSSQGQYTIEVLDVALDVVECLLAAEGEPQRPGEIACQLGINRSRAFRILKTLERRGYVESDPQAQGYRLGLKFFEIGEQVRERLELRRVAEPVLMELAQNTGDVAHLLVLYGHSAACVDRYQGDHMLQVAAPIGQPLPLHIGASPKVLLAHLPENERERIIQEIELTPFTPNTITDHDELRRCLEEVRTQGYAVDEEDFEIGVYAVGAPVRDHNGCVVAGVTVTTPESRYSPQRCQELIKMVVDAANRISARLGWMLDQSSQ
ncbi:MAG: IclR family transcriptional regulator [Anaerolineae bacterium]|nr:IclR family transcriptional regulator [Anaerolineae bacterium]